MKCAQFPKTPLIFAFFALAFSSLGQAKIIEGSFLSSKSWSFLLKFCFTDDMNQFIYELKYPVVFCPGDQFMIPYCQALVLYYDDADQWSDVYDSKASCDAKVSEEKLHESQVLYLDPWLRFTNNDGKFGITEKCELVDNGTMIYCNASRSFDTIRPRWWYFVLANCDGETRGTYLVDYKFTLLNGGGYQKHFSFDEFWIYEMYICALVVFLAILGYAIFSGIKLCADNFLHKTYILYLISVNIKTMSLVILVIAYAYYRSGYEKLSLKRLGVGVGFIAYFLLMTTVLLLAKGYTVTRSTLPPKGIFAVISFLLIYLLCYIVTTVTHLITYDEAVVTVMYDSVPGLLTCFLKLAALLMLLVSVVKTLSKYPEKKSFYIPFAIVYSVWFVASMFAIIISVFILEDWYRAKVITGVELVLDFIAYNFFGYLAFPSKNNNNFPYHVNTTQIAVTKNFEASGGDFPHQETPSGFLAEDNNRSFSDLFTVPSYTDSNTAEVRKIQYSAGPRSLPGENRSSMELFKMTNSSSWVDVDKKRSDTATETPAPYDDIPPPPQTPEPIRPYDDIPPPPQTPKPIRPYDDIPPPPQTPKPIREEPPPINLFAAQ